MSRAAGLAAAVAIVALVGSSVASAAPHWTKAVTLGPTGREYEGPQISVTPGGEALAVWEGAQPRSIQVSSRPPGRGWRAPYALAPSGAGEPQIAASRQKAVVVWSETIDARHGWPASVVFAATRLRGRGWGKPKNISAEKGRYFESEGEAPRVAISRQEETIVMWTGGRTTSFIGSATQPLGKGWTSPIGIPYSIEGEEPQVVVTPTGEAVALWHASYNEESGLEVASRPPGEKWSWAKRLANPGSFPHPQLAITSKGEAVASWQLQEQDAQLQVAAKKPGLPWRSKAFAPVEGEELWRPQVVTGPGGMAAVAWLRSRPSAGYEREEDVVVSNHSPGSGWTEPASLFGDELQLPRGVQPQLAVTDRGEWIAVWATEGFAPGRSRIQASSRRRGQPWSAPVAVSSAPAARLGGSTNLRLVVTPNGEAVAVWRCYNGSRWVIRAATRTAFPARG